jgi:hypothetical protein
MKLDEIITQLYCALVARGDINPTTKPDERTALIADHLDGLQAVLKTLKPSGGTTVESLRI